MPLLAIMPAAAMLTALAPQQTPQQQGDQLLYQVEATAALGGTGSGWDYIKMQPGTGRLFIARDRDGLTVFDVDANRIVGTVEDSVGANGPLLIPALGRGYSAMTDGSLLSFDLASLRRIARTPLADAETGLNSAVHDERTGHVHAITGTGKDRSRWFTLDAATGKLLKTTTFPFRKMDDPAFDGRGALFAPARYDRLVLKLDAETLKEQARWKTPCDVSKLRFQRSTNRLLGACYGADPQFFAMDADTGRIVATLPIGKGIDGLVIDERRRRIVTSDGDDATLTVIAQDGADRFRALGKVSTRPNARMMTMDERTGSLLLVAADHSNPRTADGGTDKVYHPGSFALLRYGAR